MLVCSTFVSHESSLLLLLASLDYVAAGPPTLKQTNRPTILTSQHPNIRHPFACAQLSLNPEDSVVAAHVGEHVLDDGKSGMQMHLYAAFKESLVYRSVLGLGGWWVFRGL